MRLAISIVVSLLISGSAWAQAGFSGQVTNSNWGVTISVESKLEPPTPADDFPGESGVLFLESGRPGMRRYTTNQRTHEYFGYDLNIESMDRAAGTFTVSFTALPSDPRVLNLKDPGAWRRAPLPSFPPPETVNISDTIAVDLFEDPGTHQKVVDYIHFSRDNCDSDPATHDPRACLADNLKGARRSLANELARLESTQDRVIISRLRESQRAWEAYLKATCTELLSDKDRLQCELRLVRNRLGELPAIATTKH